MTQQASLVFDVFFRLFNFALFCAFIAYYVRRNVIGSIRNQILRKKSALDEIVQHDVILNRQESTLQEQLEQQDTLYRELVGKVEKWRLSIESDRQMQKGNHLKKLNELNVRLDKQYASYARYKTARQVMPQVFDSAVSELRDIFSDEQRAKKYNQKALEILSSTDGAV